MDPEQIADLITEDIRANNGLIFIEHKHKDIMNALLTITDENEQPIFADVPRNLNNEIFDIFAKRIKIEYQRRYGVDFKEDRNIDKLHDLLLSINKDKPGNKLATPGISPRSQAGRPGRGDIKARSASFISRRDERLDQS